MVMHAQVGFFTLWGNGIFNKLKLSVVEIHTDDEYAQILMLPCYV